MKLKCLTLLAIMSSGPQLWAETAALPCIQQDQVLPRHSDLPANAPAFVFVPPVGGGRAFEPDTASGWLPQLKAPTGAPLAVTAEPEANVIVMRPEAPLAMGTHSVSYPDLCYSHLASNQTKSVPLKVGPPVSLPTSIGSVGLPTFRDFNSCYPVAGWLNIPLTVSAEMYAYREVATFTVTFDGETKTVPYGGYGSADNVRYFSFQRACTRGQKNIEGVITIAAHVAGTSAALDPVRITQTIAVTCPYAGITDPAKDPGNCAPSPVVDAGAGAGANLDAQADGMAARLDASNQPPEKNSGCSVSPTSGRKAHLPWLLIGASVLLLRGRTRRARKEPMQ